MKTFFGILAILGFIGSAIGELASIIVALVHLVNAHSGYPHIAFVGLLHVAIFIASSIAFGLIATLLVMSEA